MIRFLKGIFHPGLAGSVVIETSSGIGFEVTIPANSPLYKNAEGEEVKVFTSMIVKEDDMSLYGFSNKESLDLFELLITVNGVGPKAGMSIMSIMPPSELKKAIAMGDAKTIAKANGVGKKTAERVILELRDKVGKVEETEGITVTADFVIASDARNEATAALMALGYSKSEATAAIVKVAGDNLTSEDYIKGALKNLF